MEAMQSLHWQMHSVFSGCNEEFRAPRPPPGMLSPNSLQMKVHEKFLLSCLLAGLFGRRFGCRAGLLTAK